MWTLFYVANGMFLCELNIMPENGHFTSWNERRKPETYIELLIHLLIAFNDNSFLLADHLIKESRRKKLCFQVSPISGDTDKPMSV